MLAIATFLRLRAIVLFPYPFWPQASWYPELLQLVVQKPITLPLVPDLLSQLNGRIYHQNPQMLSLHAWTLSSNQSEIDSFHKELPTMSPELEEFPLGKSMMQNGKSLLLGAVEGKFLLSRASSINIADFLLYLFEEKTCQVSTIKGYRAMISNTLKFKNGAKIGSDPIISELIRSFEFQRPVQRSLYPKWDLACVLNSLCKGPYEPLRKASLLHLTQKTVFLLTLATAGRVSEIHALAMDPEHLRFNESDGSVSLRTQSGFIAKNQLPSVCSAEILVPNLARTVSDKDFNRMLCPVRALKLYLRKTESIRNNRKRLFLPIRGNHNITKGSISGWISSVIRLAYKSISKVKFRSLRVNSHELRA